MHIVFLHGWSVTDTQSYGGMPEAVRTAGAEAGLDIAISHIHLGRYISFHNEVVMDDIARALDHALRHDIPGNTALDQPFACITHSTGGPVVRAWLERFYGKDGLATCPLSHLIMLAPANHGSPLAQIGKKRPGRIKAAFSRIEPGTGILDWLELGSVGQFTLADAFTGYALRDSGVFPAVITGETIDRALYDFLNPYLKEKGSDGVVRVAGANMNFRKIDLRQTDDDQPFAYDDADEDDRDYQRKTRLVIEAGSLKVPEETPLLVLERASHSGQAMGIMGSVKDARPFAEQVHAIVRCLQATSPGTYAALIDDFKTETRRNQDGHHQSRYCQLIFRIQDDEGTPVQDFDMLLLAGPDYRPDRLPTGFFIDRQANHASPHHLTYYVDADKMQDETENHVGFRIVARPNEGFAYYHAAEFRLADTDLTVADVLAPNTTTYIDVTLMRRVDRNSLRFGPADPRHGSFRKTKPGGQEI